MILSIKTVNLYIYIFFQSVLQQASSVMNSGSSDDHLLTTIQEHYTMAGMYMCPFLALWLALGQI